MKLKDIYSHPPSVITQEDREFYYECGYLAFPGLMDDSWLNALREGLNDIIEMAGDFKESTREVDLEPDHCAGKPRLRRVAYLDDFSPIFWKLCSESILPDIAADLLGPNVRFREIMVNFKWADGGAEVKWHQDIAFYPHTHSGTLQFLLMLNTTKPDQGPLQIIPGSHKSQVFAHYDANGNWTGAISERELSNFPLSQAVSILGPPGSVSVHHSQTIHGSAANSSNENRPAFVITYSAADAIPYTAPAYPSSRYRRLVRGKEPGIAHHEELMVPLPPDWSDGYTSIFEHQQKNEVPLA